MFKLVSFTESQFTITEFLCCDCIEKDKRQCPHVPQKALPAVNPPESNHRFFSQLRQLGVLLLSCIPQGECPCICSYCLYPFQRPRWYPIRSASTYPGTVHTTCLSRLFLTSYCKYNIREVLVCLYLLYEDIVSEFRPDDRAYIPVTYIDEGALLVFSAHVRWGYYAAFPLGQRLVAQTTSISIACMENTLSLNM